MTDVVNLHAAKSDKERKQYAALVLQCWDAEDHKDKRAQKETAAEVNQQAREKL